MDIDLSSVPPPQEYLDSSSRDFDYLMISSTTSNIVSGGSNTETTSYGQVDYRNTVDRPFDLNERFVEIIDQLDTRVERFRKDALTLQEKRDFLFMSIDLIKNHEMLNGMTDTEREDIALYIKRVNSRLSTVDLNVKTVRDQSQEDSLCQINMLIDSLITLGDPVNARQKCITFLNACSSGTHLDPSLLEETPLPHLADKKFESALLGCTLDDQKNIKKRLNALLSYLNKQTISQNEN